MQEASPVSPRALAVGALLLLALTGLLIVLIDWVGIEQLKDMIEGAGPLAPLLYILFKAAAYVFAPLSSGPVQLVAGLLFGVLPGTLYTVIGEVLGGTLSFLIARHLGRPAVRSFAGEAGLARIDEFVGQLGGWRALVYARLFLFAIYDFISYAAGFAKSITLAPVCAGLNNLRYAAFISLRLCGRAFGRPAAAYPAALRADRRALAAALAYPPRAAQSPAAQGRSMSHRHLNSNVPRYTCAAFGISHRGDHVQQSQYRRNWHSQSQSGADPGAGAALRLRRRGLQHSVKRRSWPTSTAWPGYAQPLCAV